jgi:predicted Zn-dependent protease
LVFGEDPKQGYVREGVFYHPVLRFQFPVPRDWKLQNTHTQIRMLSPKQDAALLFWLSKSGSPRSAAEKFLYDSKAAVVQSGKKRVNGLPAYRLISELRTRQGPMALLSYFIQKDEKVYEFHGLSGANRFYSGYAPLFEGTMTRFRPLTDQKRIRVEPARVRVRRTNGAGSLRQAFLSFGAPEDKMEDLAILNGRHLEDRLPAGTLIKVVEGEGWGG